ncbi:MAG: heme biosynthesis protein HemY [Hyphomicrobiaceae bacterium]
MVRLILWLIAVAIAATGLSWLADRPGSLLIAWQGYEIETSVFRAIVLLALLIGASILTWTLVRQVWEAPASIGSFFNRRRHRRGLEALSGGMIAIGAGDRQLATRYAVQARRALPDEPLTHILRAQAAQLSGDRVTARRIFEAMLGAPETELLGLRGLFLEAEREGETAAARQFAERAIGINPKLGWPADALFDLQCRSGDWKAALDTLAVARKHGHIERPMADRRRAVLLTAQAQAVEDNDPNRALSLALEAHGLASDLVPATAIAGRLLAARGNTARTVKLIEKTWKRAPHPDLATVYAYARLGDSPRDRLDRIKQLAALAPNSIESPIAVAQAAIDAQDWLEARQALSPLIAGRLTQRVATLMARVEGGEHGDKGKVREWLARAVNAPRDPAWTADGVVAEQWAAVSPVTGALDALQWRVPVEAAVSADDAAIAQKLEELVPLGARGEQQIEAEARPSKGGPIARDAAIEIEPADKTATPAAPTARTAVGREAVVPAS